MYQRPKLLDLYCGAGGASMGYFLAGFDVVGMDINPQPDYPFPFIQGDITRMRIPWHKYQAVASSPPCQRHSISQTIKGIEVAHKHPDLISYTRERLAATDLPYIIENVPQAPLIDPIMLCGSMFNLHTKRFELKRHRCFETNWGVGDIPLHRCGNKISLSVFGNGGIYRYQGKDRHAGLRLCNQLMGTHWMRNQKGVSQAIPPMFTALIGMRLRAYL